MESNDSSKISWPSEYFKHISRHSDNIKVGVNQKKKTIKKTKLMWFVRKKGWSKYAKQNKSFKLEFSKKNELGNLCYFWQSVLLKTGVWALKRFLLRKKLFFCIWKNQGGTDYF